MCTGICLTAQNGDVVYARTLEFDTALPSTLGYVPRGQSFVGTTPTGQDGLRWNNRHAYAGAMGTFTIGGELVEGGADMLNEHGLVCGCFNLPGYTEFPAVTDENRPRVLGSWQAPAFVCGMYATTAEARSGIERGDFIVGAVPFPFPGKPGQFPQHLRIGDASGDTIVVEWHAADQPPTIYEAEGGVVTNLPAYSYHQANTKRYQHLSPYNPAGSFQPGSQDYKQTMGDGYLGMPGGSSSSDRFVRAYLYSRDAYSGQDGQEAVWIAWHIMNCFDLVPGILRNIEAETTTEISEYTLWTAVADTTNRVYYFRSYGDNAIYTIDLQALDPTSQQRLESSAADGITRRTIPLFED
jgi:choloylglycine hydrolase